MNPLTTIQGRTAMKTALAVISSVLLLSIGLIAQRGPEPAPARPPASAGLESVKPLIKATDEEWKVIGPRLQSVVTARQAVMTYAANTFGQGGPLDFGTDSFNGPSADGPGFNGGLFGRGGGAPGGAPGGADGGRGREGGFDPAIFAALAAGGRGGPGGAAAIVNNAVGAALAELKATLAEPTSTPEQVKAKLAAVRSARQKAVADLATAQQNLLRLLTADQEATLVSLGYLD
jgi:hypothetical protein